MTIGLPGGLYDALFMVYIGSVFCCALIALLIATFYTRKLNQPSPRLAFLATMLLAAAYLLSYAFIREGWLAPVRTLQVYLLLACGVAAMLGFLGLHFTMRKVRK